MRASSRVAAVAAGTATGGAAGAAAGVATAGIAASGALPPGRGAWSIIPATTNRTPAAAPAAYRHIARSPAVDGASLSSFAPLQKLASSHPMPAEPRHAPWRRRTREIEPGDVRQGAERASVAAPAVASGLRQ